MGRVWVDAGLRGQLPPAGHRVAVLRRARQDLPFEVFRNLLVDRRAVMKLQPAEIYQVFRLLSRFYIVL